jgi:hypothetical protein
MCLILAVPDDVAKNVLSHWLHGEDVQSLDNAHDDIEPFRDPFRSLLSTLTLKCQYTLQDKLTPKTNNLFMWGLERGVGLQVLSIPVGGERPADKRREFVNMIRTVEHLRVRDAETLQLAADHAERLVQLHIGTSCVKDVQFSRPLPSVEKLILSCENIHGFFFSFQSMISCMPNLKHVDVHNSGMQATQVASILASCPKLRHLSCNHCPNLTSALFTNLLRCPALEYLDIEGTQVQILQREAIQIRDKFPGLRTLHAEYVATDAMSTLASGLTHLEHLSVNDAKTLHDAAFRSIAEHCPRLKSVYLKSDSPITDAAVAFLVEGCRGLSHLGLSGCSKLTAASVDTIRAKCAKLEYLSHRCVVGVAARAVELEVQG